MSSVASVCVCVYVCPSVCLYATFKNVDLETLFLVRMYTSWEPRLDIDPLKGRGVNWLHFAIQI